MGAKVIEKHLTLNKNMLGPDHTSSILPKEFKEMIKNIRENIFNKYQNLSLSFFKKKKSSVLTSIIIHDVNILKATFTQTVQNLFNQVA